MAAHLLPTTERARVHDAALPNTEIGLPAVFGRLELDLQDVHSQGAGFLVRERGCDCGLARIATCGRWRAAAAS